MTFLGLVSIAVWLGALPSLDAVRIIQVPNVLARRWPVVGGNARSRTPVLAGWHRFLYERVHLGLQYANDATLRAAAAGGRQSHTGQHAVRNICV